MNSSMNDRNNRDPFESQGQIDPTPVQDQSRVQIRFKGSNPVVTYVILGITVIVYLFQAGSEWLTGYDLPFIYGGKINEFIIAGQYWRFFTPMLLHGSILHILLNMYALLMLGRGLEFNFGRWRFLALYISAGFAGNVLSFIFSPNPSLGSSTAIFGLLAAEAVFVYRNKKFYGEQGKKILINAASVAVINLVLGLSPGIDNWGHLGGLLGGIIFTWFGGPIWELKGLFPNLEINDTRSSSNTWNAAGLTILVFGAIALVKMFIR